MKQSTSNQQCKAVRLSTVVIQDLKLIITYHPSILRISGWQCSRGCRSSSSRELRWKSRPVQIPLAALWVTKCRFFSVCQIYANHFLSKFSDEWPVVNTKFFLVSVFALCKILCLWIIAKIVNKGAIFTKSTWPSFSARISPQLDQTVTIKTLDTWGGPTLDR